MFLKESSEILVRGIVLSGGAPRSLYRYLEVLKKAGCNITVIAQKSEQYLASLYETTFDKMIFTEDFVSYCNRYDILGLYKQLKREYTYFKKNRPDFVISLGHFNAHFYSEFCRSLNVPNVTLIAGGDLSKSAWLLKKNKTNHVICFSEENRDVLKDFFELNKITIISNRIQLKKIFDDVEVHYKIKNEQVINILLTSRVSKSKYNSITAFIENISKIASKTIKISLTIAGDGDRFEDLKKAVANIQNPALRIILKGHVDDLLPEFEKAHIVVGKGRSVIEPIMMNRIGCVIGDDGKVEFCSKENFDRLYHYNFSGRNLECDNPVECMEKVLTQLRFSNYNLNSIIETSELVRMYYSSEFLEDKFIDVLNRLAPSERKTKHVSILFLVVKLLWYKLKQRKVKQ